MHKTFWTAIAVLVSFVFSLSAQTQPRPKDLIMRYNQPASSMAEAIPMGNGRLAALISGTVAQDTIQLNEDSFMEGGPFSKPYASIGRLLLTFPGHEGVSNYRRFLNLEKGISQVAYTKDEVDYRRETFCSFSDQVVIVRLEASKKGKLHFQTAWVGSETSKQIKSTSTTFDKQTLEVLTTGAGNQTLRFPDKGQCCTYVRVIDTDGKVANKTAEVRVDEDAQPEKVVCLEVKGATFATVVVSSATNFVSDEDASGDAKAKAMKYLTDFEAKQKTFQMMELDHSKLYHQQFGRVSLNLGYNEKQAKKDYPTRLRDYRTADDPSLAAMYFQYGRYLLISSHQPGSLVKYPSHDEFEVAFWPAEVCNLPECYQSFLEIKNNPGGWMCHHIWNHFLFTGNKRWLLENYPKMRDASAAYEGYKGDLGMTKDNVLIYDLLKNTSIAAKMLCIDANRVAVWDTIRARMTPVVVNGNGQLQEWSSIKCVYPGGQVTPYEYDTLFQAAQKSLSTRNEEDNSMSMGWKACLWARLLNGNRSLDYYRDQMLTNDDSRLFGNLGCTAALAEMLIQSHAGYIHVLPALPDEWKVEGQIRGLKARGGFEIVEMTWKFGRLETLVIRSKMGGNLRIRSVTPIKLQDALGLKLASEPNSNLLMQPYDMASPLVQDPSKIPAIEEKDAFIYDLDTKQGKMYVFKSGM